MRDPNRIDLICDSIKALWKLHPDERLGQLMENYIFGCERQTKKCVFHIEDDQVEKTLRTILEQA
jgi:hypothetical protein